MSITNCETICENLERILNERKEEFITDTILESYIDNYDNTGGYSNSAELILDTIKIKCKPLDNNRISVLLFDDNLMIWDIELSFGTAERFSFMGKSFDKDFNKFLNYLSTYVINRFKLVFP